MQRFKSARQAQRFLSAYAFIHEHSHPRRHRTTAATYRFARATAFRVWREETYAETLQPDLAASHPEPNLDRKRWR